MLIFWQIKDIRRILKSLNLTLRPDALVRLTQVDLVGVADLRLISIFNRSYALKKNTKLNKLTSFILHFWYIPFLGN